MKHEARTLQAVALIAVMSIPGTIEAGALKKLKKAFGGALDRIEDVKGLKSEAEHQIAEIHRIPATLPEISRGGRIAVARGGKLFQSPGAVRSLAELREVENVAPRPRPLDALEQLRWDANQTYHGFWSSWLAAKEERENQVRGLRAQQEQLIRVGFRDEALQMQAAIEELEDGLRTFLAVHPAASLKPTTDFSLFGYDVTCEGCAVPVVRQSFELMRYRLDGAYREATSDVERRAILELSNEIQEIDALLAAGELTVAQQRMDARWAWILAAR